MSILAMILAGGKENSPPLTIHRAKPAVPSRHLSDYDFTLSNCINSKIRKIACCPIQVLSLDKHLRLAWNLFSGELDEYIISVPPSSGWGKNVSGNSRCHLSEHLYDRKRRAGPCARAAGDHIYKMNYAEMFRFHKENNADATVAAIEIAKRSRGFRRYRSGSSTPHYRFEEKPRDPKCIPATRILPSPPWGSTCLIPRLCWNI